MNDGVPKQDICSNLLGCVSYGITPGMEIAYMVVAGIEFCPFGMDSATRFTKPLAKHLYPRFFPYGKFFLVFVSGALGSY